MGYVEAAGERRTTDFAERVEAVRAGMHFVHDPRAYRRWRSSVDRASGRQVGLTGDALEAAIRSLATQHPEYVVMG